MLSRLANTLLNFIFDCFGRLALLVLTQPLGNPSGVCCTFRKLRLCRMIRTFIATALSDLTHILTNCVHSVESQPLCISCQILTPQGT